MVINDLLIDGNGIFHYINLCKPIPISTPDEVRYMDIMFVGLYGNRTVSPLVRSILGGSISEENMLLLGSTISMKYNHKWEQSHMLITDEILLDDINLVETDTITDNELNVDSITDEISNNNISNVSAYNDDVLVKDNSKENSESKLVNSNRNKDKSRLRERVTTGKNKNSLYTKISAIGFFRYNVLLDMMYSDTVQEIGLLIY